MIGVLLHSDGSGLGWSRFETGMSRPGQHQLEPGFSRCLHTMSDFDSKFYQLMSRGTNLFTHRIVLSKFMNILDEHMNSCPLS